VINPNIGIDNVFFWVIRIYFTNKRDM